MTLRPFLVFCALLIFALPVVSQDWSVLAQDPPVPAAAGPWAVPGLTITASQTVDPDEGFVQIKATCAGPVEWLVLSTFAKAKYKVSDADKEVIVAITPAEGIVSVFCVGIVNNKLTEFARTDITVRKPANQDPPPNVGGGVLAAGTKLYVVIVQDPDFSKRSPDENILAASANLAKSLQQAGHTLKIYSSDDPKYTANKGLVAAAAKVGKVPALVIAKQNADNTASTVLQQALPKTDADVLNLVNSLFAK